MELLFQHRELPEIAWCEIWNIKEMRHEINIAFIIILLNRKVLKQNQPLITAIMQHTDLIF